LPKKEASSTKSQPSWCVSESFTLSINIAASDLGDERLVEQLRDQVHLAGIHPGQIALELTERSTADLTFVRDAIQRLKTVGYKVHIDDFGIGFSSLSYIDQLSVNAIKIDQAFTRTIGTDAMIAPILSQMVEMASSLGLEIVVEGVETEAQRNYLAASDKNLRAQGWYYSRPLTAEALRLFESQNKATQDSVMSQNECKPAPPECLPGLDSTSKTRASDRSDVRHESGPVIGALTSTPSPANL